MGILIVFLVLLVAAPASAGSADLGQEASEASESTVLVEGVRAFRFVEIWKGVPGEGAPAEIFTAHPDVLVRRAYFGEEIQGEWLEPFTCEELSVVEAAVYARNRFAFAKDDLNERFFTLDPYWTPIPTVNSETISGIFSNRDRHTLLVTRRVAEEHGCNNSAPQVFDYENDTSDCTCHMDVIDVEVNHSGLMPTVEQ
ncbi:hypothetical protein CO174_00915 [Candidatus Uhrbacteria bacterium CG_4_9_14_3_um_filter_50_9]|uniref:YARHG domain-containing protein n=1 Tax=Candidatus Uhrbacteria bacterium CG_4_9_14_3_um_filter_50_9 TaxID=1975035 RepID=A0A2M7XE24_9BACT|nr:MAG: hypothetical protein CO174_00915 [Candidatus Uhrbacteria bacterium CG_4_9_14_3_um_filter_50_9]